MCLLLTKPQPVTDVVLLQRATQGFEYIAAPINQLGADLLSLRMSSERRLYKSTVRKQIL